MAPLIPLRLKGSRNQRRAHRSRSWCGVLLVERAAKGTARRLIACVRGISWRAEDQANRLGLECTDCEHHLQMGYRPTLGGDRNEFGDVAI